MGLPEHARPAQQQDSNVVNNNDEEIVIAIMGITGFGKTSFIKTVSGYDIRVGDSLFSGMPFSLKVRELTPIYRH